MSDKKNLLPEEDLFEYIIEEDQPVQESGKKDKKKKEKKEKRGLFGRKKKNSDFNEAEDMYYGLQLKPLDELRKGYDPTGEIPVIEDTYAHLFDDSISALDEEVERNFARIQSERRRRVAEAVETAGVDIDAMADELGIVAPPPVTSFSADPYTKQHGISTEGHGDLQNAMMETAKSRDMEIKLNVLNDTIEIQKNLHVPSVDDETVNRILESVESTRAEAAREAAENENIIAFPSFTEEFTAEETEETAEVPEETPAEEVPEVKESSEAATITFAPVEAAETAEEAEEIAPEFTEDISSNTEAAVPVSETHPTAENFKLELQLDDDRKSPNSFQEFPVIENHDQYRAETLPVHHINIDVVQSAVLTEAELYNEEGIKFEKKHGAVFKKFKEEEEADLKDTRESIDDFTSMADAKSVVSDLKSTMGKLSLRTLITGIATLVLFITGFICENSGEVNTAFVYVIISAIFTALVTAFVWKNILGGIKSIIRFRADSDSAAAVAMVAVIVQTIVAFFNTEALAEGSIHLYGAVAAGIFFMNTIGKLYLVRRIYSNFRFVASAEQKYTVDTFEDYNTSLKLAGDAVSGSPKLAYQKKAGFLKRFLQLSYRPDPAELASRNIAPLTLVASLLLCFVVLLTTKDVPVALSVFAAACCVSTVVTNMTGVNAPVANLCRKARRAGGMVVGYDGIAAMGEVNGLMMDETDLFPSGTVVLEGVKTFGAEDLESTVLSASALINEVGGVLSDLFSQVITDSGKELPKVSKFNFEEGNGVSGIVDGKSVLVGNRDILINHSITPPEREEIIKYLAGGKKALFIAVDGKLEAMMVVGYKADKRRRIELNKMEQNGVALILRAVDANITPKFISRLFDISESNINVISGKNGETYAELVKEEVPRADALVATKGRVESLMSIISACIQEKKVIDLIVAAQVIAVVLGFVLVAFLGLISGVDQLAPGAIMFYEIFWIVAIGLIPRLKGKK